jgi:hypothetical protein
VCIRTVYSQDKNTTAEIAYTCGINNHRVHRFEYMDRYRRAVLHSSTLFTTPDTALFDDHGKDCD